MGISTGIRNILIPCYQLLRMETLLTSKQYSKHYIHPVQMREL
ncbi:hypothetical protein M104_4703 [Bacteroides fragilis str. 1007-1-F |uniref:Uncharacterized protein n=1 Tax=Bacteroides fragilis str. 1007-1-F \|nr:hypothetical protein M100_0299 [Bacteroides fragilis str. 1007-1-F \